MDRKRVILDFNDDAEWYNVIIDDNINRFCELLDSLADDDKRHDVMFASFRYHKVQCGENVSLRFVYSFILFS